MPAIPLPHRPPMLLVREVVERNDTSVLVRAVVGSDYPIAGAEAVSVSIALELGAQAAALIRSVEAAEATEPARIGYLVVVRNAVFHQPTLPVAETLLVSAHATGDAGPLHLFDIEISRQDDPERILASASIGTFLTPRRVADDPSRSPISDKETDRP